MWFLYTGVGFALVGLLVSHLERRAVPLPRWIGLVLVAWAIVGIVITPVSGFWLLLVPGVLALRASHTSPSDGLVDVGLGQ